MQDLKELLNIALINTENFTLTVYHLFIVALILIATQIIILGIKRVMILQSKRKGVDFGKSHAVYQLIKYLLWVLAIIISMDTIGLKITILLAGSAALLVGLGLGLQEIFQDFVAGISILFEGTLKVNDIVEIEGGIVGKVKEIGFRTSKIETRDNIIMIVPNARFINDNVINWSHSNQTTRFYVQVGVAYGSDIQKVERILIECAIEHEDILSEPAPFVKFVDFGNSSLDFQLLFWTGKTFVVEKIKSDLRFMIDRKFRENNVTIPFPQRDVHIIPPKE
ncbi:MAG: mechanosensitive ion channel [Bacteroidetes bacterium]|nr:mechanosensitive ion channel [Bacteroidota bacterium]